MCKPIFCRKEPCESAGARIWTRRLYIKASRQSRIPIPPIPPCWPMIEAIQTAKPPTPPNGNSEREYMRAIQMVRYSNTASTIARAAVTRADATSDLIVHSPTARSFGRPRAQPYPLKRISLPSHAIIPACRSQSPIRRY